MYRTCSSKSTARDEPKFVAADIEDQAARRRGVIDCREGLFYGYKVGPFCSLCDLQKSPQWFASRSVLSSKLRDQLRGHKSPHPDNPIFGNRSQGYLHFQHDAAHRQARGALQGQGVKLHLRDVALFAAVGLVIDHRPRVRRRARRNRCGHPPACRLPAAPSPAIRDGARLRRAWLARRTPAPAAPLRRRPRAPRRWRRGGGPRSSASGHGFLGRGGVLQNVVDHAAEFPPGGRPGGHRQRDGLHGNLLGFRARFRGSRRWPRDSAERAPRSSRCARAGPSTPGSGAVLRPPVRCVPLSTCSFSTPSALRHAQRQHGGVEPHHRVAAGLGIVQARLHRHFLGLVRRPVEHRGASELGTAGRSSRRCASAPWADTAPRAAGSAIRPADLLRRWRPPPAGRAPAWRPHRRRAAPLLHRPWLRSSAASSNSHGAHHSRRCAHRRRSGSL